MIPTVEELKGIDQQIALSIGALAGIKTRDSRGNVLDALWVKYSEQSVVGMLLETNDIRKILLDQVNEQLAARKDMIQETEQTEIVCQWLMAFTNSWEREYSKQIVSQFDIGQIILSAMSEAYFEVIGLLDHARICRNQVAHIHVLNGVQLAVKSLKDDKDNVRPAIDRAEENIRVVDADLSNRISALENRSGLLEAKTLIDEEKRTHGDLKKKETAIITEHSKLIKQEIHQGDEAAIRLFFRHPNTRSLMCRIAGAILRKQEVCNRSGGYSAKVQRNDISQQKNAALDTFCKWVLENDKRWNELYEILQNPLILRAWILDHKGTQLYSDGLHYDHTRENT